MTEGKTMKYKEEIINRFWDYQRGKYSQYDLYFEPTKNKKSRPPVFYPETEWLNLIINPAANKQEILSLLALIPKHERHRWYRSCSSSQVLAQSILGNLKIYQKLDCLNQINDDEYNEPLLNNINPPSANFSLEYKVNYLKEPRQTSIDAFLDADYKIAIECKLMEEDVGNCSRPKLTKKDSNFISDYCNGSYTHQNSRKERCSLTEIGVAYWKYIPDLFKWRNDVDYEICPLNSTYQLVRNILSACVKNNQVSENNGHALLIYDERNSSFKHKGKGDTAYTLTKNSLKNQKLLRKCSWQKIINHLRSNNELDWLTDEVKIKYGM
ncbi:MAG: hypothetical protein BWY38_02973 [Ignavibacteria bacterium ADurb.Bin266]|nr:MAG: hypothetical protein BWY38_02973 [Ignavibacteria bacterium ADurb.Bin266]